jgi:hypothetical protein
MRARGMRVLGLVASAFLLAATPAFAQGQIVIVNVDGPNEGFNDPTPAASVGGNTGTTLGQQRLNVFEHAADIWEGVLLPQTDIFVTAAFNPLGPGILGSAGTTFVFRDFTGAELTGTWYHSALADKMAGAELNPGFADINTQFSSNFVFYLGFDNNEGALVDLLPVVLHELGHGLGFANFVNEGAGTLFLGFKDVYSEYTLDVDTGKIWNAMTDAERQASAINVRKVSWNGLHVNEAVPGVLSPGEPVLLVNAPTGLGPFFIGTAAFGAPLTPAGVSGDVALGLDAANAAGPSTTDACTPLTNAPAVAGKIALVDRGTCGFIVKVKNAQDAGAIAVLVADNVAGSPPAGLGGVDPTIVISSARITLTDGNTIKARLAAAETVNVNLTLDTSVLAGTDRVQGLMLTAALNPVVAGSSISHWDAVASRNQLMEPAINPDLTSSVQPPEDLTLPQMTDVGWFSDHDGVPDGRDSCIGSDESATVVIGTCDSGAPNLVFTDGCRISDFIEDCEEGAGNHGGFVSCVSHTLNDLKPFLTNKQRQAIHRCAAHHH